jgi:predicted extracellular nuclease
MRPASLFISLCGAGLGASSIPEHSIMEIQGRGHTSPFAGDSVATTGVVTVVVATGFYLQDPTGDGDPSTSDGVFAFTGSSPAVQEGDRVRLAGVVGEYRPGGDADNLTVTEITRPRIDILSQGNVVPEPTTLACDEWLPPAEIIDDDALQCFDPHADGIDFYESLESMVVRVPDAVAVSVTNPFGELWVRGPCATGTNARGGITISPGDMNPERIQIDDARLDAPAVANVGDRIGDVIGVMSYRFGNFELLPESMESPTRGAVRREITTLQGDGGRLTVASFNLRNLARDQLERIDQLATIVATNLRSPDIVALQEVQDDSGAVNDGTVDAAGTYAALIDAIPAMGGAAYDFRDIAPHDGEDGGEPGANIRVGFLFRPDRVAFVDRGRATATTSARIVETTHGAVLSHSPGRIDPLHDAWRLSRKPLAAEFEFAGRTVFVIACHFMSRSGSTPLFGAKQPPTIRGESQRVQQAQVIASFVGRLLAVDPSASIIVLGDLNDFQFSEAVTTLGTNLTNFTDQLPPSERYTYNFEGNSQALDHILASPALARGAHYDVVHVSSEFGDAPSDHDPVLAQLSFVAAEQAPALAAFPNPFRATTRIAFTMDRPGPVEVAVYDVTGRRVRALHERHEEPGQHDVTWDGLDDQRRSTVAGVYFIRVVASGLYETTRVVRIH